MSKEWLKELWSYVVTIAVTALIFWGLRTYVVAPVTVSGRSMDYTLADGERMFMFKLNKIDRFDVVVLPAPSDPNKLYIKRVIGMPGDTIEYKDDVLYLNGKAIVEPYLAQKESETPGNFTENFTLQEVTGETTVPEGKVFVMGDNRNNSLDGRAIGFTPIEDIVGEADLIIWPFDKFGLLDKYKVDETGNIAPR